MMRGDDDGAANWRDKYERLRDAHVELKKKHGDMQEELKKQGTRIRSSLSLEVVDGKSEHEYIRALYSENQVLTTKCRALELRLARSSDSKWASSRLTPTSQRPKGRRPPIVVDAAVQADGAFPPSTSTASLDPNVIALISALKTQLGDMEVNLTRLAHENEMLQQQLDETDDAPAAASARGAVDNADLDGMAMTSRVSSAHITLLEQKYADLQAQLRANVAVQAQSVAKMQSLFNDNVELQRQVGQLDQVARQVPAKDATIANLRQDVISLRNESLRLHEAVDQLTRRSLFGDAPIQTLMVQLADVEGHASVLAAQLDNETHHKQVIQRQNAALKGRIQALQAQVESLSKAEADARLDRDELQLQYATAKLQVQLLQDPTNDVLVAALTVATKATWARPQDAVGFLEASSIDTKNEKNDPAATASPPPPSLSMQLLRDAEHKSAVLKALNDDLVDELKRMQAQHASEVAFWKLHTVHRLHRDGVAGHVAARTSNVSKQRRQQREQARATTRSIEAGVGPRRGSVPLPQLRIVLHHVIVRSAALPHDPSSPARYFFTVDWGGYETLLSPVFGGHDVSFEVSYDQVPMDTAAAIAIELHKMPRHAGETGRRQWGRARLRCRRHRTGLPHAP